MTPERALHVCQERRKEYRVQVSLRGRLLSDGQSIAVEIGDISASGALVMLKGAPKLGTNCELWIEEYGPIDVQVAHAGAYFCGLSFADPGVHRFKLQKWLSQEVMAQQVERREVFPA
jgi:hypothetical protein